MSGISRLTRKTRRCKRFGLGNLPFSEGDTPSCSKNIKESFYDYLKKSNFFSDWRCAWERLKKSPGFFEEARKIHEVEKKDLQAHRHINR